MKSVQSNIGSAKDMLSTAESVITSYSIHYTKLYEKMIENKKLRSDIRNNSFKKVSEDYNIEMNSSLWNKAYSSMLKGEQFSYNFV